jgi:hypothetical protein
MITQRGRTFDMLLSLTEIANEEATDKGTHGPQRPFGHNYTDIYDSYLGHLRDEPITLVEIGLGVTSFWKKGGRPGGGSMRMWYRYFPHARIFGLDIHPAAYLDNDRVCTGVVDQGDPEQLRSFLKKHGLDQVDVIIDDGSHRADHQQISLSALFSFLKPGGFYFIEDLLANGLGEKHNRDGCDILSTRAVLKGYEQTKTFPEPNVLTETDALAEHISRISFYCPPVFARVPTSNLTHRAKLAARLVFTNARIRPRIAYREPGQETLCVLTKV